MLNAAQTYIHNISLILPEIYSSDALITRLQNQIRLELDGPCLNLDDFNASTYLSDRRMLKAMSHRDSYAMAALENLNRQLNGFHAEINPERIGMFIGACPSSITDYDNYVQAVKRCMSIDGDRHEEFFGRECMSSRPTTLLMGLPNNVLCYGSMLMNSRGSNNNFVSEGTSFAIALNSAKRSLNLGYLDTAFVGAYAYQSDPVRYSTNQKLKLTHGRRFSDGAGFLNISQTPSEDSLVVQKIIFKSADSYLSPRYQEKIGECLQELLTTFSLKSEDIGAIFTPESCWADSEHGIAQNIHTILENPQIPVLSLSNHIGFLNEVSGIAELAVVQEMKKDKNSQLRETFLQNSASIKEKSVIIFTAGLDGDLACMLIQ